jgi:ABC-type nitrate/sulfonate/bicarbonate transport system permease component
MSSVVADLKSGQGSRQGEEFGLRGPRKVLDSRALWATLLAAVILGSWELCARSGVVNKAFTSDPSEIARALGDYLSSRGGWTDIGYTAKEFGLGFVLALATGVPLGVLMGSVRRLDAALDPLISFLNASPLIAFGPLFVLWFGIGIESKVVVVFFVAVIPIAVSARAGVAGADRELIMMARSWNASRMYLARTVILPGAVPSIAAGIRLGVGYALHGVVLGEFIAAYAGLGFRISAASQQLNTPLLFACVFLISGLGVLVTEIARLIERYFSRWRPQQ